jgi:hypothetical protein
LKNKILSLSLISVGALLALLGSNIETLIGFFITGVGLSYLVKDARKTRMK